MWRPIQNIKTMTAYIQPNNKIPWHEFKQEFRIALT